MKFTSRLLEGPTSELNKFRHICSAINKTLKGETRKERRRKVYKTMTGPVLLYGSATWVSS